MKLLSNDTLKNRQKLWQECSLSCRQIMLNGKANALQWTFSFSRRNKQASKALRAQSDRSLFCLLQPTHTDVSSSRVWHFTGMFCFWCTSYVSYYACISYTDWSKILWKDSGRCAEIPVLKDKWDGNGKKGQDTAECVKVLPHCTDLPSTRSREPF